MKRASLLVGLTLLSAACQDHSRSISGPDEQGPQPRAAASESAEDVIPGQYIVTLDDAADPVAVASEHGVATQHVYRHLLTGFAGQVPDAALEALRLDARVVAIEADRMATVDRDTVSQPLKNEAGSYTVSWGLDRIDQRTGTSTLDGVYRYTHTGAGVRIYVVDTGIRYEHSQFRKDDGTSRASLGVDLMPDSATQQGADCNGHGTHVAGTAGGRTYGVAKDAQLIAVRVLSCAGSAPSSTVIAGLEWVAANAKLPAVASMSIGSGIPSRSEAYDRAVRNMFRSGVLLVMSAGNGWSAAGVGTGVGYDSCLRSPSWIQVGITVGNSNISDNKSTSSNYGECVDLFAPGSSIRSAWHNAAYAADSTRTISGTSMATPHVSGVAALVLQQARGATPQQIKDVILSQSTKNVVNLALSTKPHMLYSLVEAPAELKGTNPRHSFPCTPKRQREGICS